jgi:PAS domain S-box-containing protein
MESLSVLKYNLLLASTREIIIYFQRNGQIIECNKAVKDIFGYGDDIFHANISDIFKDVVRIKKNCLLIDSKFIDYTNETIAYKTNQTYIYVELKIILKRSHDRFIGLCIASDITIQKKLSRKVMHVRNDMKNLLKLKDRAVANIIHELRTPVSGIMGMAEILLDKKHNWEQSDNVDIIYQCSKRINSIINDLVDIVNMKNNKLILKEEKFNFHLMLDKVTRLHRYSAEEKNLKLMVNISENIPSYLIGDEFRLAQIIDNLLSNAVKFTHDGAIKLNIYMTSHNSNEVEILFMVNDTGIGIADEEKEKIFMSYYQADGSITRSYGGVGLGLSICQMLAKAMDGRIAVESTKGEGSTFSFSVCFKKSNYILRRDSMFDFIQ